ncbi:ABC transporter substrate-binding protein [Mesobacillus maritimus]|uniref:ABC transporter substrate-binding protein n=1 Tax=Mesobacillus maritimus TaxID=1643336 RepID=UPI002041FA4D|nr:ABC transporter substrate-binding protein [Mesobacillus maritimus]MCM3585576.1 ABC transporter substrate-binding protein [Mesobacillus maritimus]MCM3669048.1 ABC transporter substrate-binding protein [Mesobacillus maritimus]
MDQYLLSAWNRFDSGKIKVEVLADHIQLSTKQTRRKMTKWEQEGWLKFQSGRGRGNPSSLTWLKDVEQEYERHFLEKLYKGQIEEVSKRLLWNWSIETKQKLMTAFQANFGFHQEGEDSLLIPRIYPIITFHPLKAAEIHSANLVANLFNRLVTLNADNTITPELAHSWELQENSLLLYLRKDVTFHDGSILRSEDVVHSLQRMKQDEHFSYLWVPVTFISTPAPLVIKLEFPDGCPYVLQLLGLLSASIFKEKDNRLVGTGGFYLAEDSPEKTVLRAFQNHFGHRPLLDTVEFIQVPKEFQTIYQGGQDPEGIDTFEVESDSGFGIVIMNPYRHSDMERKEVRDYIHMVINHHCHELSQLVPRITGNHEGCLIGFSKTYEMPILDKPKLTKPIKMNFVNYTSTTSHWLKEKLEQAGLEVVMEEISFEDAIYQPETLFDSDLFIHGEIFELNQTFSYFFFLKNSYSPLYRLTQQNQYLQQQIESYNTIPFENWNTHHLKIEQYLQKESLCVPLYYVKRQIPFSINLMNVEIKHFGYVDLTKLWTKPNI